MTFSNRLISIILFGALFFACNSAAEYKEDSLLNKWQMTKFFIDGEDRSQQFNPKGDRTLILQDNGNYITKSELFPTTKGTFSFDEKQLKMKGENNSKELQETVEWTYDINGRNLILKRQQKGTDIKTEIHYTFKN